MALGLSKQELLDELIKARQSRLMRSVQSTVHSQTKGISFRKHGLIALGLKHGARAIVGTPPKVKSQAAANPNNFVISPSNLEGPLESITKKLDSIIEILRGDSLQKKEESEENAHQMEALKRANAHNSVDSKKSSTSVVYPKDGDHGSGNGFNLLGNFGTALSVITSALPVIAGALVAFKYSDKLFTPSESKLGANVEREGIRGLISGSRALANTDASVGKVLGEFKGTSQVAKSTEIATKAATDGGLILGQAAEKADVVVGPVAKEAEILTGSASATKTVPKQLKNAKGQFMTAKDTKSILKQLGHQESSATEATTSSSILGPASKETGIGSFSTNASSVATEDAVKFGAKETEKSATLAVEKTAVGSVEKLVAKESEKAALTLGKGVLKESGKLVGKGIGKFASKVLPGVGLAVGAMFAYDRAKNKDYVGAGLELVSGVAGLLPGIGTAVALATDAFLIARDISHAKKNKESAPEFDKQAKENVLQKDTTPSNVKDYVELSDQGEDLSKKINDQKKTLFSGDSGISNAALYDKLKTQGISSLSDVEKERANRNGLLQLFQDEELRNHIEDQKHQMMIENPDLKDDLNNYQQSIDKESSNLKQTYEKKFKGVHAEYRGAGNVDYGEEGKKQGIKATYYTSNYEPLSQEENNYLNNMSEEDRARAISGKSTEMLPPVEPMSSPSLEKKAYASKAIEENAQEKSQPIVVSAVDNSQTTVSSPASSPGYVAPIQIVTDYDTMQYYSNYSSRRPAY